MADSSNGVFRAWVDGVQNNIDALSDRFEKQEDKIQQLIVDVALIKQLHETEKDKREDENAASVRKAGFIAVLLTAVINGAFLIVNSLVEK